VLRRLVNMYGMHTQPKSLSSRPGGTFCIPLVGSLGHCLCSLHGLEDVITHIQALPKSTKQVLNNSQQSPPLLNTEISLMSKAAFQNEMVSDITMVSQGVTCVIIQTECCLLIPDESINVSSLINRTRTQVNAPSDLSLGNLINQWFGSWGS